MIRNSDATSACRPVVLQYFHTNDCVNEKVLLTETRDRNKIPRSTGFPYWVCVTHNTTNTKH